MKTCVIIPTYNEAENIAGLIEKIRAQNLEIVVIDDGSKDKTAQVARDNGAIVMDSRVNEGKGASLKKGFAYALKNNFDAVVSMDGDGQHKVSDLPFFMRLAKYSDSGILIGNRMHKTKSMPFVRLATNKIMSWIISKITKQKIPDSQCGFRLIKKEVLESITLDTARYETESEILIESARKGFKIESVPVETVYHGEKSHINPFVDTFRFARLIAKELWATRN